LIEVRTLAVLAGKSNGEEMLMKVTTHPLLMALAVFGLSAPVEGQQPPPSYTKDVRPFFARYCLECHTANKAKGGVNLDTFQTMMRGNKRGRPVVVPGSPDRSSLVLTTEHRSKPIMPPKKAKQHPEQTEIAVLRAWVAAGAKDDMEVKQGGAAGLSATLACEPGPPRPSPQLTRREAAPAVAVDRLGAAD
jgi:hypothetical protein